MRTISGILTKHVGVLALGFSLLAYCTGPIWAQSKVDSNKGGYQQIGGENDDTGEGGYQLTGGDEDAEEEAGYPLTAGDEEVGDGSFLLTDGDEEAGDGGYQRAIQGDASFRIEGTLVQPQQASILGNYPNPFNPETTIRFEVRAAQPIRLSVFNVLGQRVQVLVDGWMESGEHEARFDGYGLPSGTYFTRLETTAGVVTHIIMLAK